MSSKTNPPPARAAPSPPGRSMRTQPPLAVSLAAMQDLSFDASWIKAKNKALNHVFYLPPGDASKLPLDKTLLSRNIKKKNEINYEKFGSRRGHHRARHNLKIAHDFFPEFYRELKEQIKPTLDNANDCLAELAAKKKVVKELEAAAWETGRKVADSEQKVQHVEFDARMETERAREEIIKTMEERQKRDEEATKLVKMQAQAAHAMNEENAELNRRNTVLEKENIKLKSEMQMMKLEKDKLLEENSAIRETASSSGNVGLFNPDYGSSSKPKATSKSFFTFGKKGKGKKAKSKGTGEGAEMGGKRKRTRKKCNNRRLTKKMLCVRGTKRRLKKLKKHTKRLKLKLTRCSKKRLAKNFSVRKKRKYTRRK